MRNIFCILFLSCFSFRALFSIENHFFSWSDPVRGYVSHTEGNWIGIREGYSTVGLFAATAFEKGSFIPFFDGRFNCFNKGKLAANIGIGMRYHPRECCELYGANVYYDYRQRGYQNLGVGLERLSRCFDIRANGYFKLAKNEGSFPQVFFNKLGRKFKASCREVQPSFWGGDGELGAWLVQKGCWHCIDFYAAAGPYFFSTRFNHRKAYGGQVRLLANLYRYFSLEVRGAYDRHFKGLGQATFFLYFPFGCDSSNCCPYKEMAYQPVQRQPIIPIGPKECCWTWNWKDRGRPCLSCRK